jgi:hypothetical protein
MSKVYLRFTCSRQAEAEAFLIPVTYLTTHEEPVNMLCMREGQYNTLRCCLSLDPSSGKRKDNESEHTWTSAMAQASLYCPSCNAKR